MVISSDHRGSHDVRRCIRFGRRVLHGCGLWFVGRRFGNIPRIAWIARIPLISRIVRVPPIERAF
jgi:hypothetical protein